MFGMGVCTKENTTVFRSSVILALSMCYLMWAITYLAQLHPLEAPRRSDLRPEQGLKELHPIPIILNYMRNYF